MQIDITSFINNLSNKTKKNWLINLVIVIFITIFIWYFLPHLTYQIPLLKDNTDIIIKLTLTLIIWIIYLFLITKSLFSKKNRSKLPGVGFFINNSMLPEGCHEKDLFFNEFLEETKKQFKIKVYNNTNINDKEELRKILKKYNLTIGIIVKERNILKEGEEVYQLKIEDIVTYSDGQEKYSEYFDDKFPKEIEKSINQYNEISKKNNGKDSEINAAIMSAELSYIISIVYILSNTPDKAFEYLDGLSYSCNKFNDKNMGYIKKRLPTLKVLTYDQTIKSLRKEKDYYNDNLLLDRIKSLSIDEEGYITKSYKEQKLQLKEYEVFIDNINVDKSVVYYDLGEIDIAIESIKKISLEENVFTKHINLAFLLGCKNNYRESLEYYKKISRRKDIKDDDKTKRLNKILEFINCRLDNCPEDEGLKFCSAITNIFFSDIDLGKDQLKELSEINNELKAIYEELKDYTRK